MVKNEIRSVVFKHQMAELDEAAKSFQHNYSPINSPVFPPHGNPAYSVVNQKYISTPPRDNITIFNNQFGGGHMYNMLNTGV